MSTSLGERISRFRTVIVCDITAKKDELFASPFQYLAGSFSFAGYPDFVNLQSVMDAIDPHGEVTEGVGYVEYLNDFKEAVVTCIEDDRPASFILPLVVDGQKANFMMSIAKKKGGLSCLFVYFDANTGLDAIDQYVAGTYKDRLTGLFNFNTLKSHVGENRRDGYLCLFDLNKFKTINDTYGHSVGDDVLTMLSSYLIAISSSDDIFYRRSGDEFMILIFRRDLKFAMAVIDRIQQYLIELPKNSFSRCKGMECSASFGLLELVYPKKQNVLGLQNELDLCDLAMYQAKVAKKTVHVISHEDALNILKGGNLESRLAELTKAMKR